MNFGRHAFLRRINFRIIILAMTVLSLANVTAGVFFDRFYPIGYFSDKSISSIASDLAFVEGAVIFFAGAVLTFFRSKISPRLIALMVIGAAMVGLSVLLGVFS